MMKQKKALNMKNIKLQLQEIKKSKNVDEQQPDNGLVENTPQRLTKNILDIKKLKSYNMNSLSRLSVQNAIKSGQQSSADMVIGGQRITLPRSTKLPDITKSYKYQTKAAQIDNSKQVSLDKYAQNNTGSSISYNEDLMNMLDDTLEDGVQHGNHQVNYDGLISIK